MKNLFTHINSSWVKYSKYKTVKNSEGILYITAEQDAKPIIFNPLDNAQQMVIDALNVGITCMSEKSGDNDKKSAVLQFVSDYGLLGLMTSLPTTPNFMDYEAVYLIKNQYIKEEMFNTEDYLKIFFPFEMPDIVKNKANSEWTIENDKEMIALAMTMDDRPMAANMEFQREYAERYDWLVKQFKDWAFMFLTCILYYENFDEENNELYRKAMDCFDGISPSYHISLLDKPTIVWDFHSLSLGIQMMFSFMLADDENPLRMCKNCSKAFIANRPNAVFCSSKCKNQYNARKNRNKGMN